MGAYGGPDICLCGQPTGPAKCGYHRVAASDDHRSLEPMDEVDCGLASGGATYLLAALWLLALATFR